jgi:hypothetical protein
MERVDDDTEKNFGETIGVFTLTTKAAEAGRNADRQGYKVTLLENSKKNLCVPVYRKTWQRFSK